MRLAPRTPLVTASSRGDTLFGRLQIAIRDLVRSALAPANDVLFDKIDYLAETQGTLPDSVLSQAWAATGRYADPRSLSRYDAKVYSQNGEDGVLAEILRRIGVARGTFVEIGVEDGRQNVTRLLLESGWSGVWVEADAEKANTARVTFRNAIEAGNLTIVTAFAEPHSINDLLSNAGVGDHIDVLSVDIDQATHHLWRAIDRTSSVSVIEYNANLPPSMALGTAPGAPPWDGGNYFGASLKAMELIGRDKGQSLVGCDLNGINAFFVDDDVAGDHFLSPFTAEFHYEPRGTLA